MSDKEEKSPSSDVEESPDDALEKFRISKIKQEIVYQQQKIDILRIELKWRRAARNCLERAAVKLLWKRLKSPNVP